LRVIGPVDERGETGVGGALAGVVEACDEGGGGGGGAGLGGLSQKSFQEGAVVGEEAEIAVGAEE